LYIKEKVSTKPDAAGEKRRGGKRRQGETEKGRGGETEKRRQGESVNKRLKKLNKPNKRNRGNSSLDPTE